jgi:hypothetical protein
MRRTLATRFREEHDARVRDEEGVTLVELGVVMLTLLVLFAMTVPIVDTVFSTIARVNNTYTNVNQLLPISTNLQRFIRSAVQPGPTVSGVPVPQFVVGAVFPTSATFYTNIGDPNGPAKIVASCTTGSVSSGLCTSGGTFTVTEATATANSCPPTGSSCTWGTPKTLITASGVSNASDNQPLFIYTLLIQNATSSGTTYSTSVVGSSSSCIPSSPNTPSNPYSSTVASCLYTADNSTFGTCTGSTSANVLANCPGAEVYAVSVDLQVNGVSKGRTAGGQSEDDSTVYLLSPISAEYQAMVG